MYFISLAYILDYALNDKYTYESLKYYNHTDNLKEMENLNKDDKYNPYINYQIALKGEKFFLHEDMKLGTIESDYINCSENKNCSSFFKYLESLKYYQDIGYFKIT